MTNTLHDHLGRAPTLAHDARRLYAVKHPDLDDAAQAILGPLVVAVDCLAETVELLADARDAEEGTAREVRRLVRDVVAHAGDLRTVQERGVEGALAGDVADLGRALLLLLPDPALAAEQDWTLPTADELGALGLAHQPDGKRICRDCEEAWPCSTARLLHAYAVALGERHDGEEGDDGDDRRDG